MYIGSEQVSIAIVILRLQVGADRSLKLQLKLHAENFALPVAA